MKFKEFQEIACKELHKFYITSGRIAPATKNVYFGYEDYAELMSSLSPMDFYRLNEDYTEVYGFKVFEVNAKRHFELLVRE